MLETVTELSWRTVVVVHAGNLLTAFDEIVRVASVRAWWTLALSEMVVGDANSERTAADAVTGGDALGDSLLLDAHV